MPISDIVFACAIDKSNYDYFTTDNRDCLVILQTEKNARAKRSDLVNIINVIESVVSHESIHLIINKLEGENTSYALDDIQIFIYYNNNIINTNLNNLAFDEDKCGLSLPENLT